MVRAAFFLKDGRYCGFTVTGHALPPGDYGEYDLICAAVSSAVYLTCNTLTDFIGGCCACQDDNKITLNAENSNGAAQGIIRGFQSHMREMARQYPKNIILEENLHA
jgi:uncharacterized protein YsxB (DUF464 family)